MTIHNYIFAYILYLLIVLLIGLYTFKHKFNIKEVLIILTGLILIEVLISSLRPSISQDTSIYNLVYEKSFFIIKSIEVKGIGTFFANRTYYSVELFYILLMSIFRFFFKSPIIFYFVQGFISNFCMVYGLFLFCEYLYDLNTIEKKRQFIEDKLIRLFTCYLMFCGVLYTSSAIRDGLSISIGIIAIGNLLLSRKKIISSILIIFSILIHTKSIIFIPIILFLYLWKYNLSKKVVCFISILIPVLYFSKIGIFSVSIFTELVKNILELFNIQAFYSYITNLDFQLPMREGMIILLTCFLIMVSYREEKNICKFVFLTIIGLFIFVFAYPIPALARILYIFILFLIPVIISDSKYEKYIFVFYIFYIVPQLVYVFGYLNIF